MRVKSVISAGVQIPALFTVTRIYSSVAIPNINILTKITHNTEYDMQR